MDSKYGTRIRTGMCPRNNPADIPNKYKFDGFTGQSSAQVHDNLKKMESNSLSLKDYSHIYATLHCGIGMSYDQKNMTSDMVTTVLTQYHVSKGVKASAKME